MQNENTLSIELHFIQFKYIILQIYYYTIFSSKFKHEGRVLETRAWNDDLEYGIIFSSVTDLVVAILSTNDEQANQAQELVLQDFTLRPTRNSFSAQRHFCAFVFWIVTPAINGHSKRTNNSIVTRRSYSALRYSSFYF